MAQFKYCNFSQNYATEFGAAIFVANFAMWAVGTAIVIIVTLSLIRYAIAFYEFLCVRS